MLPLIYKAAFPPSLSCLSWPLPIICHSFLSCQETHYLYLPLFPLSSSSGQEDGGCPSPPPLRHFQVSLSPLAFPTCGFSHLSLRLARAPLKHVDAPKSMEQGMRWWVLQLVMGLLGPLQEKFREKSHLGRGKKNPTKNDISEGYVVRD